MSATSRLFALIPCAGTGSRSGSAIPKQYRSVAGRELLYYTLAAFDACPGFAQTLVVIAPDDAHFDARRLAGLRFAVRRCGGATRQASVCNGLNALAALGAQDDDWVLVHDAARPGITPELIHALVDALRDDPVGGIVALPVADTLKRAARADEGADESEGGARANGNDRNDGVRQPRAAQNAQDADDARTAHDPHVARIARTEARDGLWQAQTPQMFRIGLLREAILRAQRAGHDLTDEASALEWLGYAPRLVQGSLRNFKVTYPEDFALADAFLQRAAAHPDRA